MFIRQLLYARYYQGLDILLVEETSEEGIPAKEAGAARVSPWGGWVPFEPDNLKSARYKEVGEIIPPAEGSACSK